MQIHTFYCPYSCADAAAPIRSPVVNVCFGLHWWLLLFVRRLIILHRFMFVLIHLTVWLMLAWLQHCIKLADCVLRIQQPQQGCMSPAPWGFYFISFYGWKSDRTLFKMNRRCLSSDAVLSEFKIEMGHEKKHECFMALFISVSQYISILFSVTCASCVCLLISDNMDLVMLYKSLTRCYALMLKHSI